MPGTVYLAGPGPEAGTLRCTILAAFDALLIISPNGHAEQRVQDYHSGVGDRLIFFNLIVLFSLLSYIHMALIFFSYPAFPRLCYSGCSSLQHLDARGLAAFFVEIQNVTSVLQFQ